jgi:hypothetical protein
MAPVTDHLYFCLMASVVSKHSSNYLCFSAFGLAHLTCLQFEGAHELSNQVKIVVWRAPLLVQLI